MITKWGVELDDEVASAVLKAMEWTFVSDRATLDGAWREGLSKLFTCSPNHPP
jgi:hypothetical protein